MLTLDNAAAARGGQIRLSRLSLTLARGAVLAVVGPNGAGKSTLVKLLSGEIPPASGAVLLDGRPLAGFSARELAARRAVLAQTDGTGLGFTVAETAALGWQAPGFPLSRRDGRALVERALAAVDLVALADRPLDRLSGGERQRAHLARVLVQAWAGAARHGPGLLLLDEPTAAQDLAHQLAVLDIARSHAAAGGAVVAVLHDINLAVRAADRLLVLCGGRTAAVGPPAAILTEQLLAEVFRLRLVPGMLPPAAVPFILPQTAGRLPAQPVVPTGCAAAPNDCVSPGR